MKVPSQAHQETGPQKQMWKKEKEHSRELSAPAVRLPPSVFYSMEQVNFFRMKSTFGKEKSTKSVQSQPFQEKESTFIETKVNEFRIEMEVLIFRV